MTATRKPRRVLFEVLPIAARDYIADTAGELDGLHWKVTRDGERIAAFTTQAKGVELASTTARCAWKTNGQRASLKIKRADGRIRDERTYGADPTTTKG